MTELNTRTLRSPIALLIGENENNEKPGTPGALTKKNNAGEGDVQQREDRRKWGQGGQRHQTRRIPTEGASPTYVCVPVAGI